MQIYEIPEIFGKLYDAFENYKESVESVDTTMLTTVGKDLIEDAAENMEAIEKLLWLIDREWMEVGG